MQPDVKRQKEHGVLLLKKITLEWSLKIKLTVMKITTHLLIDVVAILIAHHIMEWAK